MKIISTAIPDVKIIEPDVFRDERGFFFESYNHKTFCEALNIDVEFVQDNQSHSKQNVLRGLHYQVSPKAQGKLVRVLRGTILDVAVDLRKSSSTFGQAVCIELDDKLQRQLWVPEGFAHGFLTLTDCAEVSYKTTDYYSPEHERSIIWNDKKIGIEWPIKNPILSNKDADAAALAFDESDLFE